MDSSFILTLATQLDAVGIALISTIFGGSGLAAWAAWVRAKPGANFDVVRSAKILYDETFERMERAEQLEEECRKENRALRRELDAERGEIDWLRERVSGIEKQLNIEHKERHEQ